LQQDENDSYSHDLAFSFASAYAPAIASAFASAFVVGPSGQEIGRKDQGVGAWDWDELALGVV
jgi:hypothetical protein